MTNRRSLTATATAVAALLALGAGSASAGSKARTAVVSMAERSPHIAIAGGWEITSTELTAEGGSTSYHYERPAGEADGTVDTTVSWYRGVSIGEIGSRLRAAGLSPAGALPYRTTDGVKLRNGEWGSIFTQGAAQVYASPASGGRVTAVGVWQQDGWTFTLSARVRPNLYMEERLLERVEFLGPNEWEIALQPGGPKWLIDHFGEKVGSVEQVKVEGPDGTVAYEVRARKNPRKKAHRAPLNAGFSPK
jgi:hypothetical protein